MDCLFIQRASAIVSEGRVGFPYAWNDDFFRLQKAAFVKRGKCPYRAAFSAAADTVSGKQSFHRVSPLSGFESCKEKVECFPEGSAREDATYLLLPASVPLWKRVVSMFREKVREL